MRRITHHLVPRLCQPCSRVAASIKARLTQPWHSIVGTLLLISCFALASCSNETPEQPETVGTRIIAISPAAADILIGLDLQHLIVGRHNYDTALDPSVPPVGDQAGIDYEKLLVLNPTHVIVQTENQPLPSRLREFSDLSDFAILNISTLALDDILASARLLETEFAPGNGLSDRFEKAIRQREQAKSDLGSVLVVMFTSPTVDVLGPGSAHQEIIERLGYSPAITDGKPYMPLDAEDILAIDPGVIVFIRPRQLGATSANETQILTDADLGIMAGLDLRAVRLGRTILIDDPQALTSGTSLIGVIDTLERRLGALTPLGSQHYDDDQRNTEAGPG